MLTQEKARKPCDGLMHKPERSHNEIPLTLRIHFSSGTWTLLIILVCAVRVYRCGSVSVCASFMLLAEEK